MGRFVGELGVVYKEKEPLLLDLKLTKGSCYGSSNVIWLLAFQDLHDNIYLTSRTNVNVCTMKHTLQYYFIDYDNILYIIYYSL